MFASQTDCLRNLVSIDEYIIRNKVSTILSDGCFLDVLHLSEIGEIHHSKV
jgi:hypothetical protein